MISAFFMTDDPTALNDLERIYRLLQSDIFLKGLGFRASEVPPPDDFPLITDIVLADSMIRLQDIWDTPEPWPYQYFPGVVDGEAHRIRYAHYIGDENRDEIVASLLKADRKFARYLLDRIESSYDRNCIVEFVMQNNKNDTKKYIYRTCNK